MSERRDDLSTADLADQRPAEPAPAGRDEAASVEADDRAAAPATERARAELAGDRAAADDAAAARDPLRQEPAGAAVAAGDQQQPPPAAAAGAGGALLDSQDAEAFRARWTDVQNGFVDSPRQAVEQADALVAEVMQHLARTFADERSGLERHWDRGDEVSTDDLRTAFQRYRTFFERLLAT
jgi:hypothetical protein